MLYDSKSLAPNDYQKYKAAYDSAGQHLEQAAASEKLAGKRLADATLCSPVTGFVSKRSVEPGQMASPGQTAFEIVKLDTVEVNVGVPETSLASAEATSWATRCAYLPERISRRNRDWSIPTCWA